jgi:hypothetical protein
VTAELKGIELLANKGQGHKSNNEVKALGITEQREDSASSKSCDDYNTDLSWRALILSLEGCTVCMKMFTYQNDQATKWSYQS